MQFRMVRRFSLVVATFFFTVFPSFVLAGESPKSNDSVVADSAKNLPAVHLDGNYFSRDGHRFIPVGANWVPAKAAMQWPTQWDPKAIEADFANMHELGFNTIRLDMVWAWIEPRPGDYNPVAFRDSIS